MFFFVLGIVLLILVPVFIFLSRSARRGGTGIFILGMWASGLLGLLVISLSTMTHVGDEEIGLIVKQFGSDLPPGQIIARNGEKGPQAQVLGPGWHFWYWPWIYEISKSPLIEVKGGEMGTVVACDGKPLPAGEIYAAEWKDASDMLDADKFLKDGFKGPQLTVLTPGKYRLNSRLFTVAPMPVLTVHVGEVAVVKANSGTASNAKDMEVNGVQLVARGCQGIWKEPLQPGQYYLHPLAYNVIHVGTVNRVYDYAESAKKELSDPILVRSKDGFTFPVDVRVGVSVSAADAPYMVALLAEPDAMVKDGEDAGKICNLEARLILPNIKTILRNVAEKMTAFQFVDTRSEVEKTATEAMIAEMKQFKVTTEGLFIGQIDFDANEATKSLMKTRTDMELAMSQQKTYVEQEKAQIERAKMLKSTEDAEQQKNIVAATFQVQVQGEKSKARKIEAQGEADYIEITANARKKAYDAMVSAIGQAGVVQLEVLKIVAEGHIPITPQVMMSGNTGGVVDALAGTMLMGQIKGLSPEAKK